MAGVGPRVAVVACAYMKRGGVNKRVSARRLVPEGLFAHCRTPLSVGNFLLLLALPAGTPLPSPPARALVRAGGAPVEAHYLSPASHTDPRVQGAGFFYIAPAASSLLPGMNVTATLPVGDSLAASIIPRSAVLWVDDGAWIYVQRTPSSYVRRPISTDAPTPEGYAVTGLPSGTRVVVRGAQLLLSQESRAQIPSGDEDDTH